MEINNGDNYKGEEERPVIDPWPRLEFTILKNKINLEDVLSSDSRKRPSAVALNWPGEEYEKQNPGDRAALALLDGLHRSDVTINEYLYTMPRLLQFAAKESGGFDKDFITVAIQEFDRVSARMEIPDLYRFGVPTM